MARLIYAWAVETWPKRQDFAKNADMLNTDRFQILLNNYVADIASSPERGELFVMVRSGNYEGLLDRHIDGTFQSTITEGPSLTAGDKATILKRVFADSQLATPVIPIRHARRFARPWVAAAAGLVAVAGTYLWLHHSPAGQDTAITGSNHPAQHSRVLPGGYRATLTLANESVINLDETQNGALPRQGNTVLSKPGDGQLKYTSQNSDKEILYNKVTTPRGGQYKVVLPDGSKVWLNAASSLRFPIAFAGDERSVQLTGEAYFEINPQPATDGSGRKIPFTVNVNGVKVNVLGTHFDVMAYADETVLRTTLLEGSVKVVDGTASGLLRPGQQAQVQGGEIKVVSANADNAVSWKNGFLTFEKADVPTVMRQISRWYDVDIIYEQSVPQKEFEGKIHMNAEIADLVKILETNDIHVRVDENQRRLIVMP